MYQFHTQLGYYGYVTKNVKDLLKVVPLNANNVQFSPRATTLKFDPKPAKQLNQWIQNEGNNMIFIYGANDPWASVRVHLKGKTNALMMILPQGSHPTFIDDFPKKDQVKLLKTLKRWMK